jgi:hypothetical protein
MAIQKRIIPIAIAKLVPIVYAAKKTSRLRDAPYVAVDPCRIHGASQRCVGRARDAPLFSQPFVRHSAIWWISSKARSFVFSRSSFSRRKHAWDGLSISFAKLAKKIRMKGRKCLLPWHTRRLCLECLQSCRPVCYWMRRRCKSKVVVVVVVARRSFEAVRSMWWCKKPCSRQFYYY